MKVPVLILAFNRPDHVKRAMKAVKDYQPARLYLACDGPRASKSDEPALVAATQKAMLDMVDWPCEVHTLFREKNLGCAYGVFTAISWFFEHESYGVIIEDDIQVGQDFFRLCEDLLVRYQDHERIMSIAAMNVSQRTDIPNSYVYTHNFDCWGWATWSRAWQKMDMSMSAATSISLWFLIRRLGWFRGMMMYYYFKTAYYHLETFDTWDTRWYLSVMAHDGLQICPGVNMAVNIGMDGGAHYEAGEADPYASLKIEHLSWPLVYNDEEYPDPKQKQADKNDFFRIRMIGLRKKIKKWL